METVPIYYDITLCQLFFTEIFEKIYSNVFVHEGNKHKSYFQEWNLCVIYSLSRKNRSTFILRMCMYFALR